MVVLKQKSVADCFSLPSWRSADERRFFVSSWAFLRVFEYISSSIINNVYRIFYSVYSLLALHNSAKRQSLKLKALSSFVFCYHIRSSSQRDNHGDALLLVEESCMRSSSLTDSIHDQR